MAKQFTDIHTYCIEKRVQFVHKVSELVYREHCQKNIVSDSWTYHSAEWVHDHVAIIPVGYEADIEVIGIFDFRAVK
jgi:hypothetical protein